MNLRTGRTAALLLALGALAVGASGCVPEPATPTSSATSPSTSSASASASPTTTPTASATPVPGIALPASCEQLYSPAMLQSLQATRSLNDPGITLYATQVAQALEILESGIPTLRCTWGTAGGPGLATQVSIVDATQSAAVRDALTGSGFSCEPLSDGTICRIESRTVDMNDKVVTRGETHFLRGDGWVATSWVDDQPDGYTQDIVATLWR